MAKLAVSRQFLALEEGWPWRRPTLRVYALFEVKALGLVAAVGLLVAAGAQATSSASGLRGTVTRSPITPVCVVGQPCAGPARQVTLLFWLGGRVAGRAVTDASGRYRIVLAPARYQVSRAQQPNLGRGLEPDHARVLPGRFARVDFSIDTGIR